MAATATASKDGFTYTFNEYGNMLITLLPNVDADVLLAFIEGAMDNEQVCSVHVLGEFMPRDVFEMLNEERFRFRPNPQYIEYYKWIKEGVPDGVPPIHAGTYGVTVMMTSGSKVLVVQEKKPDGSLRFKGKRKFPSGSLEVGESLVECAVRELGEELKIPADALDREHVQVTGGYHKPSAGGRPGDAFYVVSIRLVPDASVRDDGAIVVGSKVYPLVPQPTEIATVEWIGIREAVVHARTGGYFLDTWAEKLLADHELYPVTHDATSGKITF